MHNELEQLRALYQVPPNEPKSVEGVSQHYHSDKIKVRLGIANNMGFTQRLRLILFAFFCMEIMALGVERFDLSFDE